MSWFSHGEWLDVSKKERRTFFRLMKSHVLIHTTVTNNTEAVYAFILQTAYSKYYTYLTNAPSISQLAS